MLIWNWHWEAIVCWSHHMLKAQFPMPKATFIESAMILHKRTPKFVKTEWKKWLNSLHTSALASVDIQMNWCLVLYRDAWTVWNFV